MLILCCVLSVSVLVLAAGWAACSIRLHRVELENTVLRSQTAAGDNRVRRAVAGMRAGVAALKLYEEGRGA